jgi:alanine dehydrogenase
VSELLVVSGADVRALVDRATLLDALADGFLALERGDVQAPARPQVTTPDGFSLSMPAWTPGGPIAVKQVNVYEGNPARGLPSHIAVVTLFDAETGVPVALIDGTSITALRTAGAAMVAARLAVRPDARRAVIVGAGVQGAEHLAYLAVALPGIDHVTVSSQRADDARRLAAVHPAATAVDTTDALAAAVRPADVVLLCSHADGPVIDPEWVRPGTHVSSIGYAPPLGELPVELARTGRLLVETLDAFAAPPVGCGELAGVDPAHARTLGEALAPGARPVRVRHDDVTVYKAMGNAMEDLVAATLAYRAALAAGVGQRVEL